MSYNLSNTIEAVQNGELENLSDRLTQVAHQLQQDSGGANILVVHNLELKSSGVSALILLMGLLHDTANQFFHYSLVLQHVTVSPEVFRELVNQLQLFKKGKPVQLKSEVGMPIQYRWVDSEKHPLCSELVLNCMGLTDEHIAHLVPALPDIGTADLDLSYNEITSQGALNILSGRYGLTMLDLSNNKVDRSLVTEFVKLICAGTLSGYSYIDLINDGWTDQDIELIHAAFLAQEACIEVFLRSPNKGTHVLGPYRPYTENHYLVGVVSSIRMESIVTALIKTAAEKLSKMDRDQTVELWSEFFTDLRRLTQKPYPLDFINLRHFNPNTFLLGLMEFILLEMNDLNRFEIPLKNQDDEFFNGLLALIRTQPKLRELRINRLDLDPNPAIAQEKFAQLCAAIQSSRTLKRFDVRDMFTDVAQLEPVVQLIQHNVSLNHLDIFCGSPLIFQPVKEALNHNFFITNGMGGPDPVRRNFAIAQLPWRERINKIRELVATSPEELRNPEKTVLREFPSLASLAKAKVEEMSAAKTDSDPNAVDTFEVFMKLIRFLDSEILRLERVSKQRIKNSGAADKLALLKQVKSQANPYLDKPQDLTMKKAINFCRQAAIISHHRRHWVANNLFSIFNKRYREAESWRQFRSSFEEAAITNDIIQQFNPRKPLKIELKDGHEQEIRSYKEFSKAMKLS